LEKRFHKQDMKNDLGVLLTPTPHPTPTPTAAKCLNPGQPFVISILEVLKNPKVLSKDNVVSGVGVLLSFVLSRGYGPKRTKTSRLFFTKL